MKAFSRIIIILSVLAVLFGCEFKKNISREEIPIIKESISAFEVVIRARNTVYLDSILSSEARDAGMTPESILEFVYGDGLNEFVGFTHKQIFFRGNAARVDCKITGSGGPTKDVTITLRKESDVWLIKKIESRIDDPLAEDSL
jgi:hypothetical protein